MTSDLKQKLASSALLDKLTHLNWKGSVKSKTSNSRHDLIKQLKLQPCLLIFSENGFWMSFTEIAI